MLPANSKWAASICLLLSDAEQNFSNSALIWIKGTRKEKNDKGLSGKRGGEWKKSNTYYNANNSISLHAISLYRD